MRSLILAAALAVAGCSAGHDSANTGTAAEAGHERIHRGPAVMTGQGDLAACPRKLDLEQYENDMANMRVDPAAPGYEVARAYDLHNRGCIELKTGERVQVEGGVYDAESRVRPDGQAQSYWTAAGWTPAEAIVEPAEHVPEMRRAQK